MTLPTAARPPDAVPAMSPPLTFTGAAPRRGAPGPRPPVAPVAGDPVPPRRRRPAERVPAGTGGELHPVGLVPRGIGPGQIGADLVAGEDVGRGPGARQEHAVAGVER